MVSGSMWQNIKQDWDYSWNIKLPVRDDRDRKEDRLHIVRRHASFLFSVFLLLFLFYRSRSFDFSALSFHYCLLSGVFRHWRSLVFGNKHQGANDSHRQGFVKDKEHRKDSRWNGPIGERVIRSGRRRTENSLFGRFLRMNLTGIRSESFRANTNFIYVSFVRPRLVACRFNAE